jgi:hypothetical protein
MLLVWASWWSLAVCAKAAVGEEGPGVEGSIARVNKRPPFRGQHVHNEAAGGRQRAHFQDTKKAILEARPI